MSIWVIAADWKFYSSKYVNGFPSLTSYHYGRRFRADAWLQLPNREFMPRELILQGGFEHDSSGLKSQSTASGTGIANSMRATEHK
jgi:hypothetical protein